MLSQVKKFYRCDRSSFHSLFGEIKGGLRMRMYIRMLRWDGVKKKGRGMKLWLFGLRVTG